MDDNSEPVTQVDQKLDSDACSEFHIACVGASAGGLEALENFFDALPSDTGIAFVVVQHLSPDFKSHMEMLLGRHTSMAIHRVENGMQVEPDCIYLIPPKMEMVISGCKLLLTEKGSKRNLSHPIDKFLKSLASDVGLESDWRNSIWDWQRRLTRNQRRTRCWWTCVGSRRSIGEI